ncbi:MAG: response regulator [Flavobacteriia bacterium]|nr:response regulator [Flavobacteriia bacterium]
MSVKSIYIIDDDDIYVYGMRRIIKGLNPELNVEAFGNGQDALDQILRVLEGDGSLPEVILLDINMPILDGWQFLEEYLQIQDHRLKEIRIYMVSSSVDSSELSRAEGIPEIVEYVIKPMKKPKLQEIIQG